MNAPSLPIIPDARLPRTYEAAKAALSECQQVDECKDWADKAAALASYARQAEPYEARCSVYMVQNQTTGAVKIGYSGDLPNRIRALQTGSGANLHILRVIPGAKATETWLHRRFSQYRLRGEWFAFHPDMLEVVAPDEVPVTPTVVFRRDVNLTLKERVAEAQKIGSETGLSDQQTLLILVGRMTNEDAATVLSLIGGER